MKLRYKGCATSEKGAHLAEYVLLCALIAVMVLAAVGAFSDKVSARFSTVASEVVN